MSDESGARRRLAINAVVALVLIAVVSPFVVYAVPQVIGADHGLVVLSGSMEPKMSPGDAVIVREVPASEIDRMDVITFQRPGSETPTTHRVVEVRQTEDGEAYLTKGDANEDPDVGTVPYDRVVGEVILVIPLIGHLIRFANTQLGFLALVLTPMVLFVVSELWEMAKSVGGEPTGASTGPDGASEPVVPASTASAEPAGTTSVEADDAGGDDGGLTLTRSSVQLLMAVFGLYAPYTGYVAYTTREPWSIAGVTATVIGFLFCLVIYAASFGSGGEGSDGDGVPPAEDVVRPGRVPERLGERTTIPLDSVESLVQMAVDRDDWVLYDENRDTYHLARDDALYLHRPTAETDGGSHSNADDPEHADGGERA